MSVNQPIAQFLLTPVDLRALTYEYRYIRIRLSQTRGWLVVKKRSTRINTIRVRLVSEDGVTQYYERTVDISAQPLGTQAVYLLDNIDLSGLGLDAESQPNAFIPPPPGYESRIREKQLIYLSHTSYPGYSVAEGMLDIFYYNYPVIPVLYNTDTNATADAYSICVYSPSSYPDNTEISNICIDPSTGDFDPSKFYSFQFEDAYTFTDPYCSAAVCGELIGEPINPEAPGAVSVHIKLPNVSNLGYIYTKIYIPNSNPSITNNSDYYTLPATLTNSILEYPGWTGLYDKTKIAYRVFKIDVAQCVDPTCTEVLFSTVRKARAFALNIEEVQ